MPPRGYVLVFFFWALLTVITPTLINWSASAKANLGSQGEVKNEIGEFRSEIKLFLKRNEIKARRMMAPVVNGQLKNKAAKATAAQSPAPAPGPTSGNDTIRLFSRNRNETIRLFSTNKNETVS